MILDERYEIKTVLKQGDGYTLYHARHLRLEKTVWIQELDAGTEVADQAQQRARAWSDCSAVEGMVHICDQFGVNGKVYIIYEAPTGQRLSEYLGEKGTLPETALFVRADCCAGVTPESHETALRAMKMCQISIL